MAAARARSTAVPGRVADAVTVTVGGAAASV